MTCGVTRGWSPSVRITQSQSPTASTPQRSEAAIPSAQSPQTAICATPKSTAVEHGLCLGAEDDDDRIDRRHGEHRVDRVLQERAPVELGELLGRAEARRTARGEHDAADQAVTSWMRPPRRCDSRPPSRPRRWATISPMIDSAVSSA